MDLERGPLSLVSTTEELLERKSSDSGLNSENTAVGIGHSDYATILFAKVGTNFADKWRSLVGIVRSRTQATEFVYFLFVIIMI
jgi:hypothetical protein